ncbi:MAG: hypothetical protein MUP41_06070 [Desulfobacterales bacterium]|nr:hypothetical protein [Desulfobacterales bacterium]
MKGQNQYEKIKKGLSLTPKQAILAQCYVCNGESEGGEDCLGLSCPLYQFMHYRKGGEKRQKRELTQEQRTEIVARLKRARNAVSLV